MSPSGRAKLSVPHRAPDGIVIDPFLGSGTVGKVCEELGRKWIGCELNPGYEPLIRERTKQRGLPFRRTP
jgi:DNA modification methylase